MPAATLPTTQSREAILDRVHEAANGALRSFSWDDDIEKALTRCAKLTKKQLEVATKAHDELVEFVIVGLAGCGSIEIHIAGLINALVDFAETHGLGMGHCGWQPLSTRPEQSLSQ